MYVGDAEQTRFRVASVSLFECRLLDRDPPASLWQELEDFLASITAGGTGAGPGGLTATPPEGSAPSGGGHPRPGASWTPA